MIRTFLLGCASLLCATPALAAPAWEFVSPSENYSNGVWNFATAFAVNSDVVVSGIGYYADTLDGLANPVSAALYQCADTACLTTGTLLAQATIDNTYAQYGHFRYMPIAPITLLAGTSYEVAGVSNNNNYTWNAVGYADDPAITRLATSGSFARWEEASTPSFLTGSAVTQPEIVTGYLGPNLFFGNSSDFTGTPEPATWTTMIIGFGLIGAALRRRRQPAISPAVS